MVSTIDGKTVSGDRNEDVFDLGSKNDHELMRRIEDQTQGVIAGASTIRAAPASWDPRTAFRVAVTRSGRIDFEKKFFTGEGRALVACPRGSVVGSEKVETLEFDGEVDFRGLLKTLREMGCERLLCFGGSELNAQLLRDDLVDELFLTVAPKVKLGRGVPTYAGGEPLPREGMLRFSLVEHHVVGDEVFLRYRRRRD
jgi:riboflavin biosynthesis pyrimidine reductase